VSTPGRGASRLATRAVRRHLVGPGQPWVFRPPPAGYRPPRLGRTSVYLHVPLCRNECPYCPYAKVAYRPELAARWRRAALAEASWWARALGPAEITSVYVGGGTPTLALDDVAAVLERLRSLFRLEGDICVETSPADVDAGLAPRLREAGVTMVSLGVQSFSARRLETIGRRYAPAAAEEALRRLTGGGFAAVNADIMFALPGQTAAEVVADLRRAADLGADQVTTYPLFTFPYSAVGRYLRLRGVRLPDLRTRRAHYRAISAWARSAGFERVSVWAFRRGSAPRYSSVTRDGYIGIGPGAGSHLPDGFALNTFDLDAWAAACEAGAPALALWLPFVDQMSGWWWLYWRVYDTRVPDEGLERTLGPDAAKARRWLRALEAAALVRRQDGVWELTGEGAFWLHLAQNHFALAYVDRLWTAGRGEAWPAAVVL
jgi:oxygen-independent coproporphyrinogen III oxidase